MFIIIHCLGELATLRRALYGEILWGLDKFNKEYCINILIRLIACSFLCCLSIPGGHFNFICTGGVWPQDWIIDPSAD